MSPRRIPGDGECLPRFPAEPTTHPAETHERGRDNLPRPGKQVISSTKTSCLAREFKLSRPGIQVVSPGKTSCFPKPRRSTVPALQRDTKSGLGSPFAVSGNQGRRHIIERGSYPRFSHAFTTAEISTPRSSISRKSCGRRWLRNSWRRSSITRSLAPGLTK